MPGINDFIDMATKQLGVSSGAAQSGAGGLLSMLKDKVGGDLFGKVAAAIPGAADLVGKAPGAGGGGVLGGLMEKAGGLLGGSAGGAMGVAAMLGKAGIPLDKARGFGEMFLNFVKSKLSPDLLKSLLAKAGDLGKLVG
ncbi:MAG: DUF2780 domain-containing protein [Planctomycetota bacterium]